MWGKIKSKPKTSAGWLVGATILVIGFEGMVLKPYKDKLAYDVLTVCAGETRNVDPNKVYTLDECKDMLRKGLAEFEGQLQKCIHAPMTDKTKMAIVSWSWNVGTGAACKSTLVRKLNAGDYVGACNQLLLWDKAGGKVVRGLQIRREQERKLCLAGL